MYFRGRLAADSLAGTMPAVTTRVLLFFGALLFCALLLISSAAAEEPEPSPLVRLAAGELQRSFDTLRLRADPKPYFVSYRIVDERELTLQASAGAMVARLRTHDRWLTVQVRVGSYALDNTHRLRGSSHRWGFEMPGRSSVKIPLGDRPEALRGPMRLETERQYRRAADRFEKVRTDDSLAPQAEDRSGDFSKQEPVIRRNPLRQNNKPARLGELCPDQKAWEARLREWSALLSASPIVLDSVVALTARAEEETYVDSEGSQVEHGRTAWRVTVWAEARADDGMDLSRHEAIEGFTEADVAKEAEIRGAVERVVRDLTALRRAPKLKPFVGPAILSGYSAGVYFHEVLGHRVEGHRQKDEEEGQTFVGRVGEEVLPSYLSVIDDPTRSHQGAVPLNGHYAFDAEGRPAERVQVVDKGRFQGFLMSRSPVQGFSGSNGHGRAAVGRAPVGRQGNLFIVAHESVPERELREQLRAEIRRQQKPFGLYVERISGGFTLTGRVVPNSFNVRATMVRKVFADGRPDELVRGADLIGTPLTSLRKVTAAGDRMEVFNGHCGAESGWVPVSAIAPALLISELEIQKKELSPQRPPVMPPPAGGTP